MNTKNIEITKEQIYKGDLLLVNKDYPVKKDSIRSDIINVNHSSELVRGYVIFDRNLRLSKGIVGKFFERCRCSWKRWRTAFFNE